MSDETFRFDECAICTGPAWLNRASTWCGRHRPMLLIAAGIFQVRPGGDDRDPRRPLIVGETILLQVEPVDPRDLFRGDYVALSYAINRVPPEGIEGIARSADDYGQRREPEERTVYVSLAPRRTANTGMGPRVDVHGRRRASSSPASTVATRTGRADWSSASKRSTCPKGPAIGMKTPPVSGT